MFFLLGALIGTFLISRLFWLVAKPWPDDSRKALLLNIGSGLFVIIGDYLIRPDPDFIFEVLAYGSCQVMVLFYDLWRISRKKENKRQQG